MTLSFVDWHCEVKREPFPATRPLLQFVPRMRRGSLSR